MIDLDDLTELAARQLAALCRKAADRLDPPAPPAEAASPGSEGQGLDEWFTTAVTATNATSFTTSQPVSITWIGPPGT